MAKDTSKSRETSVQYHRRNVATQESRRKVELAGIVGLYTNRIGDDQQSVPRAIRDFLKTMAGYAESKVSPNVNDEISILLREYTTGPIEPNHAAAWKAVWEMVAAMESHLTQSLPHDVVRMLPSHVDVIVQPKVVMDRTNLEVNLTSSLEAPATVFELLSGNDYGRLTKAWSSIHELLKNFYQIEQGYAERAHVVSKFPNLNESLLSKLITKMTGDVQEVGRSSEAFLDAFKKNANYFSKKIATSRRYVVSLKGVDVNTVGDALVLAWIYFLDGDRDGLKDLLRDFSNEGGNVATNRIASLKLKA